MVRNPPAPWKRWLVVIATLLLLFGTGQVHQASAEGRIQRAREGMSKRWNESRFNLGQRFKEWRESRKAPKADGQAPEKKRWWHRRGGGNIKGEVRKAVDEALSGYTRARLKLRQKSRTDSRTAVTTKLFKDIEGLAAKHGWAAVIPTLQSFRGFKNDRWGSFIGIPEEVRRQVMALSASTAQQQEAAAKGQQAQETAQAAK